MRHASYRIGIHLTIRDAGALWSAAAESAITHAGMTIGEVLDLFGPREDPDAQACLAMLVDPSRFAGCEVEASTVETVAPEKQHDVLEPTPECGVRPNRVRPPTHRNGVRLI